MKLHEDVREINNLIYFFHDAEHEKIIGILMSPSPQIGNFMLWDDDVYQVQTIRLITNKKTEDFIGGSQR